MRGAVQRYLPVALSLRERAVLVVGGGVIGTHRVRELLACEARVRVISPEVTGDLDRLADAGAVELERRVFQPGDCAGHWLVVAATSDPEVNRRVTAEAEAAGALASATDDPDYCNFVFASSLRRGALTLSIFTHGEAPVLSRRVRRELELAIGPEYEVMSRLIAELRARLRDLPGLSQSQRQQVLERVVYGEGLQLLREGQLQQACRSMRQVALEQLRLLTGVDLSAGFDWPGEALLGAGDPSAARQD